ncbi:MAG: hypothetical protein NC098_04795 [Lachnoclostridium sp.]|nr:hypothetical protein [Lachnoclostridium sp.]
MIKDNLNLATAFAFMACDGDISPDEVKLIKQMNADGIIPCDDVDDKLEQLLGQLNARGHGFMKDYFQAVTDADLDADAALALLKIAVATIYADEIVEYSEVKFFRAVRSHILSMTDEQILEAIPEVEDFWLESDVKSAAPGYLDQQYMEAVELPQFDIASLKK